jgi:hypothetical protein
MSVKGEKYKSMAAMKMHEKGEGPAARKKEYGSAKGGIFGTKKKVAKKVAMKKMGKKK